MATHDYHEGLPGYHPDQVLRDGCAECERRGKDPLKALLHMDRERFAKAWQRAIDYDRGTAEHVAVCERDLLDTICLLGVMLERFFGIPTGTVPTPTDLQEATRMEDPRTAEQADWDENGYPIKIEVRVKADTIGDVPAIEDAINKAIMDRDDVLTCRSSFEVFPPGGRH